VIGISMMDCEKDFLSEYASVLNSCAQTIHLVVGGPYPSIHYETILKHTCISYVIVGEGEKSFLELLHCLVYGLSPDGIKGLAWCSNNGLPVYNGQSIYIENLDDIPIPDYDLIDLNQYQGFHPNMNGVLADSTYNQAELYYLGQ
jgi:radical SAM superfamily enzyme YgiQ (UPF0313 family)